MVMSLSRSSEHEAKKKMKSAPLSVGRTNEKNEGNGVNEMGCLERK